MTEQKQAGLSGGKAFPKRRWIRKSNRECNHVSAYDSKNWTRFEHEEYLSLEEHSALIAELKAENERLRAALKEISEHNADWGNGCTSLTNAAKISIEALKDLGEK